AIDGQQLAITPHRLRPRCNDIACQVRTDCVVIIGSFERSEIELADVNRLLFVSPSAFAAFEVTEVRACLHDDAMALAGSGGTRRRHAMRAESLSSFPLRPLPV